MALLSTVLQGNFQGIQGVQGTIGNPTSIPQNSQTTSYQRALSDVGKHNVLANGYRAHCANDAST